MAVNEAGEGEPSSEVSATVLPIPQNVSASAGEGEVTVTWDDISRVTTYNLYQGEANGVTTANGTLVSNVTSPYIFMGLSFGSTM